MSIDRHFASAFGILLAIMLTNPAVGIAQSCDALLGDGAPFSYRFRANVPRREGMYRYPVSGDRGMTLVSPTLGRVTCDAWRDQYLEIKLPVEPAVKRLIRALGVPERLYYRLDAELGPGQSVFRLPLGGVVAPENILPEAFGMDAVKRPPVGYDAFLPIYARAPGVAAQAEVVAVVRPGADVSDVQWRRSALGVPPSWPLELSSGLVAEGTRLEIGRSKDMPPQTTLEVSFLLQASAAQNSGWGRIE
ncbi:MAG: hypothetical protein JO001_20065 [Alphaproteobacteria bacterium]|nr:hypothetical protein [Alphaproteobacteria bacterium]